MPPPAVDGLNRVTHGGQCQPVVDSPTEQRRERHPLRMAGVLVLIEQYHPEAAAQLRADLRKRRRQPRSRGHLRAEVHHLLGTHALVQRIDQRHQLSALGLGGQHPQQPLAGAPVPLVRPGGQRVHQSLQLDMGVGQLFGVDEVLGQLTGQPKHHRGDGGGRLVGVERPGVLGDDAKRQLPQLRFAEQPGVGFDRKQQAVLTQQRSGERVIGADRYRVVGGVQSTRDDAGARKPGQPGAHAAQQLSRGLAGERQAEHLTGRGVAVGHQPHHPGGHRFGLARPRTRDHHQRTRRCRDDRSLFVGRGEKAEGRSQFGGAVRRRHDDCADPSATA